MDPDDASSVRSTVRIATDPATNRTTFTAPDVIQDDHTRYFLQEKDTVDGRRFLLDLKHSNPDSAPDFTRAIDRDGREFMLTSYLRDSHCGNFCFYEEDVRIQLDHDYLVSHTASGIDLQLIGRSEAVRLQVPAGYLRGFLAGVGG